MTGLSSKSNVIVVNVLRSSFEPVLNQFGFLLVSFKHSIKKLRTKPAYVAHLVVIIAALTYMPIKHLFLSDGLSWSSKNEDNLPAAFLVLEKITKPGFQLTKAYTGCSID